MTSVTVAAGQFLVVNVSGFQTVYFGGDTALVPTFEVIDLRSKGVIV